MANSNNGVIVVGLDNLTKKFERLRTSDSFMAEMLQAEIERMLRGVRARLVSQSAAGLQLKSDPRQLHRAIRYAVYKKVFGGNVNILNKRKAGALVPYDKLTIIREGQWGGNRRHRSAVTARNDGYFGSDRGFIFRFLNQGTDERKIKNFTTDPHRPHIRRGLYGGDVEKYGKTVNTGLRGGLSRRDWFGPASMREMKAAIPELEKYIDRIIVKLMQ